MNQGAMLNHRSYFFSVSNESFTLYHHAMIVKLISFLLLISTMVCCSHYKLIDRKNLFVMNDYSPDTITLQDYIFCSNLGKFFSSPRNTERPLPYEANSIINAIEERFYINNLKLNSKILKVLDGENKCDSLFINTKAFRIDEDIQEAVLQISKSNKSRLQLIPYMIFFEMQTSHLFPRSIVYPGGFISRTMHVAMIIVEDNKIVYIKTDQYIGKNHEVESNDEYTPILDFSILQELIASTLEDYFERIKH